MKRMRTRLTALFLSLAMALSLLPAGAFAAQAETDLPEAPVVQSADVVEAFSADSPETAEAGLGVASRTVEEIQAFAQAHPASLTQAITYQTQPSLSAPYQAGVLSDETQTSALNLINQIRYIAGLDGTVTLDPAQSALASAGALVNCLNGSLSHTPQRPSVLSDASYDALYQDGRTGAGDSNISSGFSSLNDAILDGWMSDQDPSNIANVGHRRWILAPFLTTTGFGAAGTQQAMYVSHNCFQDWGGKQVAWPAQNTPVQYFDAARPWSISLGYYIAADGASVQLTRKSDGAVWNFGPSGSDGDFFLSSQEGTAIGSRAAVIFRPTGLNRIQSGDSFDVSATINDVSGSVHQLSYTVNFFDLGAADGETQSGLHFHFQDGTLTLSGEGALDSLASAEQQPWASYRDDIHSVVIEEGCTSIGAFAFANCANLTSISIPKTVAAIGARAFYNCSSLADVSGATGVTTIGDYAFGSCTSLTSLPIPSSTTVIGAGAFWSCTGVASVTIPDGVTSVGAEAFSACRNLTSASFPRTVTTIGLRPFYNAAALSKISVDANNPSYSSRDGILFDRQQTTLLECPDAKTGAYTVPNTVTEIAEDAFSGSSLSSVTIPDSVQVIHKDAFSGSGQLTNVTIGTAVMIGDYAFHNCVALTSIYFTGDPPSCGEYAFYSVTADAYYPIGNEHWADSVRKDYGGQLTWTAWAPPESKPDQPSSPEPPDEPAKPAVPAAPKLRSIANGSKGIKVTWGSVSGAAGYRIYRKLSGEKRWTMVKTVRSSVTAYTDSSVKNKNGTLCRYTVRAYARNDAGITWGTYSSSGLTTVRLATSSLSSLKNVRGRKMTAKWSRNTKATGYLVQYSTNKQFSGLKQVRIKGNKNISPTFSGLARGKRYYLRVRSYRTYGGKNYYSGWSNVRYVTIKQ